MTSEYYTALPADAQRRYKEKLRLVGNIDDPYLLWESSERNRSRPVEWYNWPDVEYPDIYNYLIETPSLYTKESLKAYKSLSGYRLYSDGWISKVNVYTAGDNPDFFLGTGLVRHSQSISATPLKPWVGMKKNGCIVAAHCTCKAGLGEACSHVAGLLFTLEANTRVKHQTSCTSLPCSWLPPSFQDVTYEPIASIDFSLSKLTSTGTSNVVKSTSVAEPSDLDKNEFFTALSKTKGRPAILSLVPDYCESYIPLVERGIIPQPLTCLFNPDYLNLTYHDLLLKSEEVYSSYTLTEEQVKAVETATRGQSKSITWYQQRAGRVTASRLKSTLATSLSQPSESLIKSSCYPESTKFYSAACSWGCVHEETARKAYFDIYRTKHKMAAISKIGLVLHPKYPFMGASPDGLIECKCCGKGVLEVKCPYSCRDKSFSEKMEANNVFLEQSQEGNLELKKNHQYYYQIQMQMKFCEVDHGDFVVWSHKELFIQRMAIDDIFITGALSDAQSFIKKGILPELIGKNVTREPVLNTASGSNGSNTCTDNTDTGSDVWCYCKKGEEGDMIGCDSHRCPVKWFHLSCLKLTLADVPKGKWYCNDCRKTMRKKQKK